MAKKYNLALSNNQIVTHLSLTFIQYTRQYLYYFLLKSKQIKQKNEMKTWRWKQSIINVVFVSISWFCLFPFWTRFCTIHIQLQYDNDHDSTSCCLMIRLYAGWHSNHSSDQIISEKKIIHKEKQTCIGVFWTTEQLSVEHTLLSSV